MNLYFYNCYHICKLAPQFPCVPTFCMYPCMSFPRNSKPVLGTAWIRILFSSYRGVFLETLEPGKSGRKLFSSVSHVENIFIGRSQGLLMARGIARFWLVRSLIVKSKQVKPYWWRLGGRLSCLWISLLDCQILVGLLRIVGYVENLFFWMWL